MPFRASELALGQIMTALETDGVNIIGLHGMPGVGKTTLAKQVHKEAVKKELFDEYLIVTVSEKPDTNRIQSRFAEQLKLGLKRTSSMEEKASKLIYRLLDEEKKLLVLDDVWGEFDLSEIGIPPAHYLKNCKILLTTRRIQTCDAMKCQRRILLDTLAEDEAWALFKNTAKLDDGCLTGVAKMVAKECSGLPLAIMSVANALRGKTRISAWKRALEKLQEGEIEDIRDINREKNAYRSLKFSFDMLPREETKKCLLQCAFFPEDYAIFVPQLASYAIQLGICKRSSNQYTMEEFSEEVDELRNSHLLQESEILQGAFTMHDLVRDVVLKLGKKYSIAGDPKTKEFENESLALQMIAERHFKKDRFTSTPNESSGAEVPIMKFIESQELVLNKSAESALVQLIKALQTDGINMIGLHGLHQVGKSTWASQVAHGAVRMKLFEECIFVCVPKVPDIRAIQSQIATILKLELEERSSTQHREIHFRQRLMNDKKKILVLDNVWQELNLDVIGIPSIGNLKILITTPRKSVCKAMACQMEIRLDSLTKDEESSLINKIKNSKLEKSIKFEAYKMIEQCKRSPKEIQAGRLVEYEYGSASMLLQSMQNEPKIMFQSMLSIWKEFSSEEKRCMMLCSLYAAEDEEISVEELGRYTQALGVYGSTPSIEYTMTQLMTAIEKLLDYHFLLPAATERHIQLHVAARNLAQISDENMSSSSF